MSDERRPDPSREELQELLRAVRPRVREMARRFELTEEDVQRITRDVLLMIMSDRNPEDRERLFLAAFERQCERLRLERESDDGAVH